MRPLAILLIVAMIAPDAGAAYSWYRSVTVAHAQVPNTDQASFPMLICANGSSPCNTSVSGLNQSGGGAKVQNSNGYDIGFFTDNTCTTKVTAWEVERYTASTGEILIWVNDGTISHTADTVLYLCYGDATISTFQSTTTNVWDSNYLMVAHGTTGGPGSVTNSKSGGTGRTRGDGNPAVTTGGPIGSYLDAPASSFAFVAWDGVSGSEDIGLPGSSDFTMETWMNFASADSTPFNFYLTLSGATDFGMQFYGGDNNLYWDAGGAGNGRIHTDYSSYFANWTHIVLTSKGDDSFGAIYLNGSQIVTRSVGQMMTAASDGLVFFYNITGHASYDEVRFSKTVRSADWVSTSYNNQHSPSTFITFGTETAVGGGGSAASNRGLSINGGHLKVSGGHLRIQ